MTGYYRNGFCETGYDDFGTHTVCAKMDKKFLDYTASKGNDLSSVVKPGQKWCLCEYRWNQAYWFFYRKSGSFYGDHLCIGWFYHHCD